MRLLHSKVSHQMASELPFNPADWPGQTPWQIRKDAQVHPNASARTQAHPGNTSCHVEHFRVRQFHEI